MNIKVDIYLIISIAILTFFKQVEPFLYFYLFITLHELAHIIVAIILKIKPIEISFLPFGVNAKFDFQNHKIKEIIIASAGPIFSACTAFILKDFKVQNLFIMIMNLLPIFPLDGGRIFKNIIILAKGLDKGSEIYNYFLKKFLLLMIILNIIVVIIMKNYHFIIVSMYLFQIAGEEIKKDKIRQNINSILNIEI